MATLRVGVVQAEPAILDRDATLAKCVGLVREAAAGGARLVVFPETFVPGYAQWTHSARFEHPDHKAAHLRLAKNSVRVPEDLNAVAQAARDTGTTVILPVTEAVAATPGTLYNTMVVFGPDGRFVGKHRKLVGTHHERIAYEQGGGDTLRAFDVDGVRFGGLLCWNNFMPLARYALYQQGIQIYLAPTADDTDTFQDAMRYIARESRCFVLSASLLQRKSSFPDDWELADDPGWTLEDEWNERGGSCIVGPDGRYIAGPVYEDETILFADLVLDRVIAERQTFDPAGHYSRHDVLQLAVKDLEPL